MICPKPLTGSVSPASLRQPSIKRASTPDCRARSKVSGVARMSSIEAFAGDMRELRRAEECRQRHDNFSSQSQAKLGDGPVDPIRRKDTHHAGFCVEFAARSRTPWREARGGKAALAGRLLATAAPSSPRMAMQGIKQGLHDALIDAPRKIPGARGGLVIAYTRGCAA